MLANIYLGVHALDHLHSHRHSRRNHHRIHRHRILVHLHNIRDHHRSLLRHKMIFIHYHESSISQTHHRQWLVTVTVLELVLVNHRLQIHRIQLVPEIIIHCFKILLLNTDRDSKKKHFFTSSQSLAIQQVFCTK